MLWICKFLRVNLLDICSAYQSVALIFCFLQCRTSHANNLLRPFKHFIRKYAVCAFTCHWKFILILLRFFPFHSYLWRYICICRCMHLTYCFLFVFEDASRRFCVTFFLYYSLSCWLRFLSLSFFICSSIVFASTRACVMIALKRVSSQFLKRKHFWQDFCTFAVRSLLLGLTWQALWPPLLICWFRTRALRHK